MQKCIYKFKFKNKSVSATMDRIVSTKNVLLCCCRRAVFFGNTDGAYTSAVTTTRYVSMQ